ncbi:uncharacterized protein ACHE_80567S [Aspergillus chevalieri]|uniref:Uncharacterized protein n=1 Tax=Aspergillus chevalieri TaxID=182096 RepID=A0A7R7VXN4_ASPCH|nr:uncharacterized protein ACHE_80567S [Aspergillus chevalieri]BCR92667.1 hypothetical protein ACHE_80567S [Aspergillus chevalieri]
MDYRSGYNIARTGTNSQGNPWCNRDYGNGSNSYHYSNSLVYYFLFSPIFAISRLRTNA